MDTVQKEYRRNKKKIYAAIVLMAVSLVVTVYLNYNQLIGIPLILALLAVSFGLVFLGMWKFWRCPSCNSSLGKFYIGSDHRRNCPACGVKLVDIDRQLFNSKK